MRTSLKWICAATVALPVAGAFAIGWLGSERALRPPWYERRTPEQGLIPLDGDAFALEGWQGIFHDPLQDLGIAFEEVEFPAIDGQTLRGWYVPGRSGTTVGVVAVHGAGADRREFLRQLPVFHDPGYPVLLFDCREQGISDGEGRGISLGIREHEDVSSAVAYMKRERGLERVAVVGTSQGGASVILAAAKDPEIDAVIAENPFTSIPDLIDAGAGSGAELPAVVLSLIEEFTLFRMGGLDVPAPIDVVDRIAPRPLLIMHGDADRSIPVEQSRRLYLATGGHAALWIAPGATHAALYNLYPDEWRQRVQDLLFTGLGSPSGARVEAAATAKGRLHR